MNHEKFMEISNQKRINNDNVEDRKESTEPKIFMEKKTRIVKDKTKSKSKEKKKESYNTNQTDELIEIDMKYISDNESIESQEMNENVEEITTQLSQSSLLENYDREEERRMDSEEEILKESHFRLAIKPINPKYQIFWDLYKKQHEAHWTAEEVDFSMDVHDFMKLDKNIQHFIKRILAFFAGADTIVNINIKKNFSKITIKEAEVAYGFQLMMENIHGEVYADMLINIIQDSKERNNLINAFKRVKSIKKMIQWAQKWIESERRIAFSIVVFVIFEGLMFSGAFASIYWLKKIVGEDRMKGLIQSNNLIAKDEGMHTNFGCVMYDFVVHKLTQTEINTLMTEAVQICKEFTKDAIRVDMIGMNTELMHSYIEYVADRLMVYLGYDKIYNTKIPDQFQFMDTIGFLNKDNFFERRPTEYQKAYNDRNRANWSFKINSEY